MLACKSGVECQPQSHNRHPGMQHTDLTTTSPYSSMMHTKGGQSQLNRCGSDFAYLYFCSFVFLSSFLVSKFPK
jgi:hypothetical protein